MSVDDAIGVLRLAHIRAREMDARLRAATRALETRDDATADALDDEWWFKARADDARAMRAEREAVTELLRAMDDDDERKQAAERRAKGK